MASNIELMDAPARRIHGKVEITYTDPFMDNSVVPTTLSEQACAPAIDAVKGLKQPAFKGFSLHDNKLNGTYHPLGTKPKDAVGWWAGLLSDAQGYLTNISYEPAVYGAAKYGEKLYTPSGGATSVAINLAMSARPFFELRVVGDILLNSFPVDFDIVLYDDTDTPMYTENVVGNTQCVWVKPIEAVVNICRLVLTVHRINKPFQVLKIVNLYSVVVQTYDADSLVSINLLEEIAYDDNGISIGAVSSNEIDVELDNTDRTFSIDNPTSIIATLMKKNRIVKTWLGLELSADEIAWYEMGTYYTTSWRAPLSSMSAVVTARDRLEVLRNTDFKAMQVYTNISLYNLFNAVLADTGIPSDEYIIDAGLSSIIIPHAWFPKCSHREALTYLASCGLIAVFCDRKNRVIVDLLTNQPSTPICTMDNDVNVFNKEYPMSHKSMVNSVEIQTYSVVQHTETVEICNYTDPIIVPAQKTKLITVMFNKDGCSSISAPTMGALNGATLVSYTAYTWGMDLTLRNTTNGDITVSGIVVSGRYLEATKALNVLVEDAASIQYSGKEQAVPINHKLIQSNAYAKILGDQMLATYLKAGNYVTLECRGNLAVGINDAIAVKNAYDNSTKVHWVSRQKIVWDGALKETIEGR